MEKDQFNQLLSNYTSLSAEEATQLILLQNEFPYSQVIHGLTARAAQDNQVAGKENHLHLSAIYSTDRAVLKSIMTCPVQPRKQVPKTELEKLLNNKPQEALQVIEKVKPQPLIEQEVVEITRSTALTSDELYDEVMHDVETLRERKLQFELAVSNLEKGNPITSELTKSKKGKPADPEDGLIQEIKTSKKKIKPEGPKQKEQIEIIDQFIKTQPTISKNKLVASIASESKDDLSEKSLTYGENIVSETLVQILLKQGKKEKAIEVLKKLIWKFPQKKAYFAAQIEDLKK
ncbi:MAG: hypothetical protein ABL895_14995 [Cyclobacteriaceae bacterium]